MATPCSYNRWSISRIIAGVSPEFVRGQLASERSPTYGLRRQASVAEAGTKRRARSNPASRFLLLSVRSVALPALPFVLGKPVEIGESGTRELFSLALTGLRQTPL